jgi:hypothetical protein
VSPKDYREEMRQRVLDADREAAKRHTVSLVVSRQNALDLIEAYNQLNQMNPWFRGVARRLRDLSLRISDALDNVEDGVLKE